MQIGMIGLGRMGSNMVRRLMRAGHSLVVFDRSSNAVNALVAEGATGSTSLADLVARLSKPRVLCAMVPVGAVAVVAQDMDENSSTPTRPQRCAWSRARCPRRARSFTTADSDTKVRPSDHDSDSPPQSWKFHVTSARRRE